MSEVRVLEGRALVTIEIVRLVVLSSSAKEPYSLAPIEMTTDSSC